MNANQSRIMPAVSNRETTPAPDVSGALESPGEVTNLVAALIGRGYTDRNRERGQFIATAADTIRAECEAMLRTISEAQQQAAVNGDYCLCSATDISMSISLVASMLALCRDSEYIANDLTTSGGENVQ